MEQDLKILIGAAGAGVGALVAGILMMLNGHFERRAADRRHRREMAVKAAMEQWKINHEFAMYKKDKFGTGAEILPPEAFIVGILVMLDELPNGKLTPRNVSAALDRAFKVNIATSTKIYDNDKKRRQQP